jgi:uncharacterized membrane-anchored protein
MNAARWRVAVVLVTLVAILALVNVTVHQRETLLTEGRVVLLELAPVDPRSLLQGDYMRLNFAVARALTRMDSGHAIPFDDGHAVFRVDDRSIGQLARKDDGTPLAPDEIRIRYRVRGGFLKFATNAWFFEEGHAADFASARYGELRVSADGEVLLSGLRDKDLARLVQRDGASAR